MDTRPSSRRISTVRRTVPRPTSCSCWSCFSDGSGPFLHSALGDPRSEYYHPCPPVVSAEDGYAQEAACAESCEVRLSFAASALSKPDISAGHRGLTCSLKSGAAGTRTPRPTDYELDRAKFVSVRGTPPAQVRSVLHTPADKGGRGRTALGAQLGVTTALRRRAFSSQGSLGDSRRALAAALN